MWRNTKNRRLYKVLSYAVDADTLEVRLLYEPLKRDISDTGYPYDRKLSDFLGQRIDEILGVKIDRFRFVADFPKEGLE